MKTKRVTYEFADVIEREEYLDGRYGAPGEKRSVKKKATPEQVAQVNQWNKEKKARHRLRKYFKVNDYLITLTYPKDRRPKDMKQAKADFREFYLAAGKEYKKRGMELRSIPEHRVHPDRELAHPCSPEPDPGYGHHHRGGLEARQGKGQAAAVPGRELQETGPVSDERCKEPGEICREGRAGP